MKFLQHTHYKLLLKDAIQAANRRGFMAELARAAGCTQSYMSQAIHGKPEITPDQAIAIAEFLKMDGLETDFFLHLVHFARASTPKLKAHHGQKLKEYRERKLRTESVVEKTNDEELSEAMRNFYYSSWNASAVHVLTACPQYQKAERISARLNLSVRDVEITLQELANGGLVKKAEGRFSHTGKNLHLPTQSIYNYVNHLNWRLHGLQSSSDEGAVHYTSVFAIDRKDWDILRARLLSFIESQRDLIGKSGSEDAFVFCCDLFKT